MQLYKESFKREKMAANWTEEESPVSEPMLLKQEQLKKYGSKEEIMRDLMEERYRKITEIKSEVNEVAEIYKHTVTLMNEQQPWLDVINTQLDTAEDQTEDGIRNIAQVFIGSFFTYQTAGCQRRNLFTSRCLFELIFTHFTTQFFTFSFFCSFYCCLWSGSWRRIRAVNGTFRTCHRFVFKLQIDSGLNRKYNRSCGGKSCRSKSRPIAGWYHTTFSIRTNVERFSG
jgi:hypothetical protein